MGKDTARPYFPCFIINFCAERQIVHSKLFTHFSASLSFPLVMTLENVIICFARSPRFELRMCLNCDFGALHDNTLFLAREMSKSLC